MRQGRHFPPDQRIPSTLSLEIRRELTRTSHVKEEELTGSCKLWEELLLFLMNFIVMKWFMVRRELSIRDYIQS